MFSVFVMKTLCVVIFVVVKLVHCDVDDLHKRDKSNWVDPNNMEHFDRNTNSMRRNVPVADYLSVPASNDVGKTDTHKHVTELQNQLADCRRNLLEQAFNYQQQPQAGDVSSSSIPPEVIIFKHLLGKISKKFGLNLNKPPDADDTLYFTADIRIKKAQIVRWSKLLADPNLNLNMLQDCVDDFVTLFSRVKHRTDPFEGPGYLDFITNNIRYINFILLMLILIPFSIQFLYRAHNMSRRMAITAIFVTIFISSTVWTWIHLVKVKQAELNARFSKRIPEHCLNSVVSDSPFSALGKWVKGLVSFPAVDECVQYQKDLLIDPLWEVTPSQAIAVTITRFFIEPLEYLGEGIARFFKALLKDTPLTWQPFILVFVIIILLMLLFFVCGYRIRAFYGLFSFEPVHPPPPPPPAVVARQQNAVASGGNQPALQPAASAPNVQIRAIQ